MILKHLTVEVYGEGVVQGVIHHRYLNIHAIARYCNVGQWTVKLPSDHAMAQALSQPGSGIMVSYRGKEFLSGPMESAELEARMLGVGEWTFTGPCDNVYLDDMTCWPAPTKAIGDQGEGYDSRSGKPYELLVAFAKANDERRYPPFGQLKIDYEDTPPATWPGNQNTINYKARFDNMLELAQSLVERGAAPFEVRTIPLEISAEKRLRPLDVIPGDGSIRFDTRTVGGIETTGSALAAPSITRAIVGGTGHEGYRNIVEVAPTDPLLEDEWGRRIERFRDERSVDNDTELVEAGEELLEDGANTQSVQTIELTEDTRYEWGEDFTLGTMARIIERNEERESRITAIAVIVDSDGLRVGVQVGEPESEISRLEQRISKLERVETTSATPWVPMSVLNGWEVFPFNQPQYRVNHGELQLRGGVANGTTGVACVNLPVNLRPTQNKYIITRAGNGGVASITVGADGNVNIDSFSAGGDNSFVGLEAVRFYLN